MTAVQEAKLELKLLLIKWRGTPIRDVEFEIHGNVILIRATTIQALGEE